MTKDKDLTIAEKFKEQLNTPKTETRITLKTEDLYPDLAVKKSKLSPAARAKVVNRNGSNYVSERTADLVTSYGPCLAQFYNADGCNCNFGVTAILTCLNGTSRTETMSRPKSRSEFYNLTLRIQYGDGVWVEKYEHSLENCFVPSNRARAELAQAIKNIEYRCGHQTVTVTDKREWN